MRTKSFWIISLIPPLAMIVMFAVNYNSRHVDSVLVDNRSSLVQPVTSTNAMNIQYGNDTTWAKKGYDAYVRISDSRQGNIVCDIYSQDMFSPVNQMAIKDNLETKMAEVKLGVDFSKLKAQEGCKLKIVTHVENPRFKLLGISVVAVFLIYLIVLQFASSILRMTGREKQNKICEILLSAMPARVIMAGKLIACLLVAFIQLLLWCIVAYVILSLSDKLSIAHIDQNVISSLLDMFASLPHGQLVEFVVIFMLYLIGGFLLYCTLFSILGAISNENTNTQQFSLIVTIPLLVTFVYVFQDFGGESQCLQWLSYIPLSSPVACIPVAAKYGMSTQIVISLLILYATTLVTFYYACILYHKGVLASKAKVTLKMMMQWIKKK